MDPNTAPPDCNFIIPKCPLVIVVDLALGQTYLQVGSVLGRQSCPEGVLGGVDLDGLVTSYLFCFGNGSKDANWQDASKGFAGNVVVDSTLAKERTSGGVAYAGRSPPVTQLSAPGRALSTRIRVRPSAT